MIDVAADRAERHEGRLLELRARRRSTSRRPAADFRDGLGTDRFRTAGERGALGRTRGVAVASGDVDAERRPPSDRHVRASQATATAATCAYYQYLQGTSMASPHAVGVAALIVASTARRTGFTAG